MRTDYIKFCLLVGIGIVAFIFAIAEGDTISSTIFSKLIAFMLAIIDVRLYKRFVRE